MLSHELTLYPVNILQLVFAFTAAFGAMLVWPEWRFRSLAVFLLFQAVLMALNFFEEVLKPLMGTHFLVSPLFTLAKGPLLYLFIRAMVNEAPLRGLSLYRHFFPIVLVLLFTRNATHVTILGSISQLAYFAAVFLLLRRYERAAGNLRSDADALRLDWVVTVFRLFVLQVFSGLIRLNVQRDIAVDIGRTWYSFDLALLFGLCCYLLYKVLRQPQLFDDLLLLEDLERAEPDVGANRWDRRAGGIFAGLNELVEGRQLYKQPRLAVQDLAALSGLQMKDISWAINQGAGRNFNDYINGLRIDELKRLISAGAAADSTLLDLAFEVGFTSKSTFNAVFRRQTGMTPSQYLMQRAGTPELVQ